MKKIIIIKYGELTLKKKNKNYFIKTLKNNIDEALKDIEHETIYDFGRMFIETDDNNLDLCTEKLKKIFGIYEIVLGYKITDRDIDTIRKGI